MESEKHGDSIAKSIMNYYGSGQQYATAVAETIQQSANMASVDINSFKSLNDLYAGNPKIPVVMALTKTNGILTKLTDATQKSLLKENFNSFIGKVAVAVISDGAAKTRLALQNLFNDASIKPVDWSINFEQKLKHVQLKQPVQDRSANYCLPWYCTGFCECNKLPKNQRKKHSCPNCDAPHQMNNCPKVSKTTQDVVGRNISFNQRMHFYRNSNNSNSRRNQNNWNQGNQWNRNNSYQNNNQNNNYNQNQKGKEKSQKDLLTALAKILG